MKFVRENTESEIKEEVSLGEDVLTDVDFSQVAGKDFKKSLANVKKKIKTVKAKKAPAQKLNQEIPVRDRAFVDGYKAGGLSKVIVARDRKVIIEQVNKFILSDDYNDIKRINYYKGNKLKEVVLAFNNNTSAVDVNLQIFNPSDPMNYLHSTSQNINDYVKVADSTNVLYTDVLFNILANPLLVYNAKIVVSGANSSAQINEPMRFRNKNTGSEEHVKPIAVGLLVDSFQKIRDSINFFEFHKKLNRPFIADGMDVIEYRVLAGMTVTLVFFCRQKLIKHLLYPEETAGNKILL